MQGRRSRSNVKSGDGSKRNLSRTPRVDRHCTQGSEGLTRIGRGDGIYQIGQEIGRGGFGVVFQALNISSGDFVAVKRVALHDIDNDSLASIKLEIDLLKKLNHRNIVQYIDTIQTETHLHIILEIMESSLSAMCKKFGNFSESLTAIYMTQVLEGLKYLHEQGVLHRDIKGANILTTKNGILKLADFGVAIKLNDSSVGEDLGVVGTPYWMAPEIIEMKGTTSACDIWSVGCTIIELLTGKPPYYDLQQMSALYKIVQDDHPPLPNGISPMLRDFLLQCFMKEPSMRKSAAELLNLQWLKDPKNHIKKIGGDKLVSRHGSSGRYEQDAVLNPVRTYAKLPREGISERDAKTLEEMVNEISIRGNEDKVDDEQYFSSRIIRSGNIGPDSEIALQHKRAIEGAGNQSLPTEAKISNMNISQDDLDGWDDVFGDDIEHVEESENDIKHPAVHKKTSLASNSSWKKASGLPAHSMAVIDAEENNIEKFIEADDDGDLFNDFDIPPSTLVNSSLNISPRSTIQGTSLAKTLQLKLSNQQNAMIIGGDPFGADFEAEVEETEDEVGVRAERDFNIRIGQSIFAELCKLENNVEEEEVLLICSDVCAQLAKYPEARFYVLTPDHGGSPIIHMAHIELPNAFLSILSVINELVHNNPRTLEHLVLVGIIPRIIHFSHFSFKGDQSLKEVIALHAEVAKFVKSVYSTSDLTLQMFISAGGIEVLASLMGKSKHMAYIELVVPTLVEIGIDGILAVFALQRNRRNDFCRLFMRLGLLPSITDTLTYLLSCVMIKMSAKVKNGNESSHNHSNNYWNYIEKCGQLLITFSKSDGWVKEGMVSDACIRGIMSAISDIVSNSLVQKTQFHSLIITLLTVIKNVSMEPNTLEQLASCKVFSTLIPVLDWVNGYYDKDIESQVIQSMFYLCRISRKRQEKAAAAGLVPCLQRCIKEGTLVQQFALQIICDLAHTSSLVRDILWKHLCFDFFIAIISSQKDKHWHVTAFRSLSAWFLADTDRVLRNLVNGNALKNIINLFCTAQQADFEIVVEELHSMMQKSAPLVKAFGASDIFVQEVKARLHYPKAMVGKSLLAMLRLIYRNHPKPRELDRKFSLYQTISKLAKNNSQVLVAEMATLLLADIDELGGKYGI